nr:amidohydrolase family protein [Verticiella sp. GG226]
MHLYDPVAPYAPGPVLQHTQASVADYQRLQARLGLTRNVIVQPSSYGVDHQVLLAGLRAFGGTARGVAVVQPSVDEAELSTLNEHGVVGVRFNLVQVGATTPEMLAPVAERVRPLGWHVQIHARSEDLLALEARLLALDMPIVIDHYARVGTEPALTPHIIDTVRRMLATGRVWLKLSAPYIGAPGPQGDDMLGMFVRQLAADHLEQLVWGTDWPHVTEATKPDDALLMDVLPQWLTDQERRQILVDNPARLYSFGPR